MHNEFPVVSFPKPDTVLNMDKRYQWSVFKNGIKIGCRFQLPLMLSYSYTDTKVKVRPSRVEYLMLLVLGNQERVIQVQPGLKTRSILELPILQVT